MPEPIEECRGQVIADRPVGFQGVMPDRFQEVGLARPGLADKYQHPRPCTTGKSSGRGQHIIGSRSAFEIVERPPASRKRSLGVSELVVPALLVLPAHASTLGHIEQPFCWIAVDQDPPDIGMGYIEIFAYRT
jgi:hypothetical protein